MLFFQKIIFAFFLLPVFLQLAIAAPILVDSNTLTKENRWIDLPEYNEYLKQLGKSSSASASTTVILPSTSLTTTLANADGGKYEQLLSDSPLGPFAQLPTIQLCKEPPKENNFYGHIYCVSMVIMYALLVLSLIIYVLRSIVRINNNNSKKKIDQNFELKLMDGLRNSEGKDEPDHLFVS